MVCNMRIYLLFGILMLHAEWTGGSDKPQLLSGAVPPGVTGVSLTDIHHMGTILGDSPGGEKIDFISNELSSVSGTHLSSQEKQVTSAADKISTMISILNQISQESVIVKALLDLYDTDLIRSKARAIVTGRIGGHRGIMPILKTFRSTYEKMPRFELHRHITSEIMRRMNDIDDAAVEAVQPKGSTLDEWVQDQGSDGRPAKTPFDISGGTDHSLMDGNEPRDKSDEAGRNISAEEAHDFTFRLATDLEGTNIIRLMLVFRKECMAVKRILELMEEAKQRIEMNGVHLMRKLYDSYVKMYQGIQSHDDINIFPSPIEPWSMPYGLPWREEFLEEQINEDLLVELLAVYMYLEDFSFGCLAILGMESEGLLQFLPGSHSYHITEWSSTVEIICIDDLIGEVVTYGVDENFSHDSACLKYARCGNIAIYLSDSVWDLNQPERESGILYLSKLIKHSILTDLENMPDIDQKIHLPESAEFQRILDESLKKEKWTGIFSKLKIQEFNRNILVATIRLQEVRSVPMDHLMNYQAEPGTSMLEQLGITETALYVLSFLRKLHLVCTLDFNEASDNSMSKNSITKLETGPMPREIEDFEGEDDSEYFTDDSEYYTDESDMSNLESPGLLHAVPDVEPISMLPDSSLEFNKHYVEYVEIEELPTDSDSESNLSYKGGTEE